MPQTVRERLIEQGIIIPQPQGVVKAKKAKKGQTSPKQKTTPHKPYKETGKQNSKPARGGQASKKKKRSASTPPSLSGQNVDDRVRWLIHNYHGTLHHPKLEARWLAEAKLVRQQIAQVGKRARQFSRMSKCCDCLTEILGDADLFENRYLLAHLKYFLALRDAQHRTVDKHDRSPRSGSGHNASLMIVGTPSIRRWQ